MTRPPVTAVVPVKGLDAGKSRLVLPAAQRRELTAAFAVDVVSALRASPPVGEVVVVTGDPAVERLLQPFGVRLVPDPGGGLRSAVRTGSATAGPGSALLIVPADLPFLSGTDVTHLLDRYDDGFVPDRSGTGTTLLLQPPGATVDPQYGQDSAARHARLGLRRLDDVPSALRHDVDSLDDLVPGPGERLAACTAPVAERLSAVFRRAG